MVQGFSTIRKGAGLPKNEFGNEPANGGSFAKGIGSSGGMLYASKTAEANPRRPGIDLSACMFTDLVFGRVGSARRGGRATVAEVRIESETR